MHQVSLRIHCSFSLFISLNFLASLSLSCHSQESRIVFLALCSSTFCLFVCLFIYLPQDTFTMSIKQQVNYRFLFLQKVFFNQRFFLLNFMS